MFFLVRLAETNQSINRNYHSIYQQFKFKRSVQTNTNFKKQVFLNEQQIFFLKWLYELPPFILIVYLINQIYYSPCFKYNQQENIMMNVYILITLNLIVIALLVFLVVDPTTQMKRVSTQAVCLQSSSSRKLCAQCYKRDQALPSNKGYKIESKSRISVLKITEPEVYLSCNEYLQFIEIDKDLKNGNQYSVQKINSINSIMEQLKSVLVQNKGSNSYYVVQPWYQHFVTFKWVDLISQQTYVWTVNPEDYTNILSYFTYGFNFVLLVILVAWIADHHFLSEQLRPVKIFLALIVICMELYLFDINKELSLYLLRILILNIGLLRVKVNNFKVIAYFGAGLILSYFDGTRLFYTGLMLVLLTYYRRLQKESRRIQHFLLIFYTIFLINHLYWNFYVMYLNDLACLIIQLAVITSIPIGIFLLPNDKDFRSYRPADPEIRSISLSGFDEDEESGI